MSQILTQEEVDALLRGITGGQIDTEIDEEEEPSDIVIYDLASQDRIIRGRMPTLEMTNEKFARMFRTTLSSMLRKVVSVNSMSVDMIKFGEFLKTLPVPTSLHIFRMEPLRGNAIFVMESKVIFTLVDVLFGGAGKELFKVEGREFTAIETNLIKKVILSALSDLEKAWKTMHDIHVVYQRSEINPQFAQIVPPTDLVFVVDFEIEVEYITGILKLCIPYSTVEPIREKLQAGFQSEQLEIDKVWMNRFRNNLMAADLDILIELGNTQISAKDAINLKLGDVITLDKYCTDPVNIFVEGIMKFKGYPGIYKGNQAVKISEIIQEKEVCEYGTE